MIKETYAQVEIDEQDIIEFLNYDFYDLPWTEMKELADQMKQNILTYDIPYYGSPLLNSTEILEYLKRFPDVATEVRNGLIEKEANN